MRRILILTLLSFISTVGLAQVSDNFADGDFTNAPAWSGSVVDFIVNGSQQLQLNNSVGATSFLTTPFSLDLSQVDAEWQFFVSQTFAPSGSNFGRIYLVADQADLTQPLNGYYIQLGESGSADAPELFRQTGSTRTSVCRASTSGVIASTFSIRLKATRSSTGLWQLLADYSGGTNFTLEASATDATHTSSTFFGVQCVYTSSNSNKFFFDDFSITSTLVPDTTAPGLLSISVNDNTSLNLLFSEPLDVTTATDASHYVVNQNVGTATTAVRQGDLKTVAVTFANGFKNGYPHKLTVSGIQDLAGNPMSAVETDFLFFQPIPAQYKSVIVTEILADPSPQVGLPDVEFIEIFNRSSEPFDVGGWKFSDGSSIAILPSQIILPSAYWIITASSNVAKFSPNLPVIGTANFPTLNNDLDALTLKDASGLLVDSLQYSLSWYRNADKQEGGWSLELIDPENICGEADNWIAAEDDSGGTPGMQNSVNSSKPDLSGPKLLTTIPAKSNQLLLSFDEKLEKMITGASFMLSPFVKVTSSEFKDQSLREIVLDLEQNLANRVLYTVHVVNLHDCTGNLIQDDFSTNSFALAEQADSLEVVINEILFNPRSGGVDFVELFNTSPKYINLKNWKLSNMEDGALANVNTITTTDYLFAPGAYLALTSDVAALKMQYPMADEKKFLSCSLPSLPDDEGSVAVVNDTGKIMDSFFYNHDFHSPLVQDEEGISLERISTSQPTQDPANWKSASSVSGFATPGAINSNARPESTVTAGKVEITPEIFSPGSGYNDFTTINFAFDQPGCIANVKIYDQQGHLVKTVASNETMGYEGFFRWDGDREDGTKARMGYYIVWFEVVDLSGSVRTFRKRVVVAARE